MDRPARALIGAVDGRQQKPSGKTHPVKCPDDDASRIISMPTITQFRISDPEAGPYGIVTAPDGAL
jgi:hypothetical protein